MIFKFSPVDIFFIFSRVFCVMIEEIAPKCGEDRPISEWIKQHRILSCVWLSWFSRPLVLDLMVWAQVGERRIEGMFLRERERLTRCPYSCWAISSIMRASLSMGLF